MTLQRQAWWPTDIYTLLAPSLVLVTPFLVFLKYHGYAYARLDTVVCLLLLTALGVALGAAAGTRKWMSALILVATILLLIDIQSDSLTTAQLLGIGVATAAALWLIRLHAARIVTFMAATMAMSSLVMPRAGASTSGSEPGHGNPALPLVVHVILDEHIGVEGLPASPEGRRLKKELRSFFAARQFRLFGGAYSEYFNSNRSISHLLNFVPGQYDATLFESGTDGFTWNLKRNRYFDRLVEQGYTLHVYQSDYFQMCPGTGARCETYSSSGIGILQQTALSVRDRVRLIASVYLDRSIVYTDLKDFYRRARNRLARSGIVIPPWNWERNRVGAITSAAMMERLRQDLAAARRGDFIFAHLLIPHSPYVYDETCGLLPLDAWEQREMFDAPPQRTNTSESRQARYEAYSRQVRCAYRKLDEIFNSIPPDIARDAVIIVHGDHGSRIVLVEPLPARASLLQASDYADGYSTLFAVRSPRLDAGYDTREVAITCLLKTLSDNDYRSLGGLDACAEDPSVFLVGGGKAVARQLPSFDQESH